MIHIRFLNKKNQIFRKLNFYSFLPKPNNDFSIPFIRNRTHYFTWFFLNRLCNFLIEFRPKILFKPINRLVKQKKIITSSILVFRTKFPPNKKKYSLPVFSPSHQKNGEFTGCSSLCVERTNWWPKNYTFFRGQYLGPQILLKKCSILTRNIIFSMFMRTKS